MLFERLDRLGSADLLVLDALEVIRGLADWRTASSSFLHAL